MKLGHYCKDYIWQAALRIYANQPAHLKCESSNGHFQPGEGPSRGLLHDCETSIFSKVRLRHYWILGEDARPEQMFRVNQITFMTGCWAAAGGRADYVFWLIAAVSASAAEPRSVSSPQSSPHTTLTPWWMVALYAQGRSSGLPTWSGRLFLCINILSTYGQVQCISKQLPLTGVSRVYRM